MGNGAGPEWVLGWGAGKNEARGTCRPGGRGGDAEKPRQLGMVGSASRPQRKEIRSPEGEVKGAGSPGSGGRTRERRDKPCPTGAGRPGHAPDQSHALDPPPGGGARRLWTTLGQVYWPGGAGCRGARCRRAMLGVGGCQTACLKLGPQDPALSWGVLTPECPQRSGQRTDGVFFLHLLFLVPGCAPGSHCLFRCSLSS